MHHDAPFANGLGGWSRVLAVMKRTSEDQARFTPRQMRIPSPRASRLRSDAIAAALYIAPSTVKKHVDRICVRLGADGRFAGVAIANRYGRSRTSAHGLHFCALPLAGFR